MNGTKQVFWNTALCGLLSAALVLGFATAALAQGHGQGDPVSAAWETYQGALARFHRAGARKDAAAKSVEGAKRRIKTSIEQSKAQDRAFRQLLERYNRKRTELIETFQTRDEALKRPRELFKEIDRLERDYKALQRASGRSASESLAKVLGELREKHDQLNREDAAKRRLVENTINPHLEALRAELRDLVRQIDRGAVVRFDGSVTKDWATSALEQEDAQKEYDSAEAALAQAFDDYIKAVSLAGPPYVKRVEVRSEPNDHLFYKFRWVEKSGGKGGETANVTAYNARVAKYKQWIPRTEHRIAELRRERAASRQRRLDMAKKMVPLTQTLNDAAEEYGDNLVNRVYAVAFTDLVTTVGSVLFSGGLGSVASLKGFIGVLKADGPAMMKRNIRNWASIIVKETESKGDAVAKLIDMYNSDNYAQPYEDLITHGPITNTYQALEQNLSMAHPFVSTAAVFSPQWIVPAGEVTASRQTDQTDWGNQWVNELQEYALGDLVFDNGWELFKGGFKDRALGEAAYDFFDPASFAATFVTAEIKTLVEQFFATRIKESQTKFWNAYTGLQGAYLYYYQSLAADREDAHTERVWMKHLSQMRAYVNGFGRKRSADQEFPTRKISASDMRLAISIQFNYPLSSPPVLKIDGKPLPLRGSGDKWTASWEPSAKARAGKKVTLEIGLGENSRPFEALDTDPATTALISLKAASGGKPVWEGYERGIDRRHVLRFDGYDLSGLWLYGKTKYRCVHTPANHRFQCYLTDDLPKAMVERGWRSGKLQFDAVIENGVVSGKIGASFKLASQKKCPAYSGVTMADIRNGVLDLEKMTISNMEFHSHRLHDKDCKVTDGPWVKIANMKKVEE